MYAVRISEAYQRLEPFFARLVDTGTPRLVVYEHPGGHAHCHALLETKLSTDTLKNWVKKALGVTVYPKTNWSFKTAENDGFITYMSKGQYDPKLCVGYTPEQIADLRARWVDQPHKTRGELTQYKLKTENPKEAKARQNDLIDQVIARLRERPGYTSRDVLETIRQVVVVEHRTIIGRYKMRDYYDYVALRTGNKAFMERMEEFVSFRV